MEFRIPVHILRLLEVAVNVLAILVNEEDINPDSKTRCVLGHVGSTPGLRNLALAEVRANVNQSQHPLVRDGHRGKFVAEEIREQDGWVRVARLEIVLDVVGGHCVHLHALRDKPLQRAKRMDQPHERHQLDGLLGAGHAGPAAALRALW